MSTMENTPSMREGIPGVGRYWPRRWKLSQHEINQAKQQEKFHGFFIKKECNEQKVTQTEKRLPKGKKGGGTPQSRRAYINGRRKQAVNKNKQYTMTYTTATESSKAKEKQPRSTQGEIPTSNKHNGVTSTIFGHSVEKIDNQTTFRALFQNPNGINPQAGNHSFLFSLTECYNHCVALILGLAETNREWKHYEQQKQLREAMHKIWKSSVVQTSTTIDTFEDNYKPGGTLTAICDDHWTSRIVEKGEDPWGLARWSYILLAGKKEKRVLSVNGYRVCTSSESTAGETTAWKQQFNILRERMSGKIDPRRQNILDMQAWLMSYISQGVEVILYLDGNEDITNLIGKWCEVPVYIQGQHVITPEHDGSLATLVTTCGLVDVIKEQHQTNIPSTYARGTKRLDYVFVSPQTMDSVERSTILPCHTMFNGDHCPILIDFNADRLFGDPSHNIQRQKMRGLKLNDPRIVDKYIEITGEQLSYHKIFDKTKRLKEISEASEWTPECVQQYEKIDRIITESVRYADKAVAKRYSDTYEWSPEMMRSVNAFRYWSLRLKVAKGVVVDNNTIKKCREDAKLPLQQSEYITGRQDIVENLRDARKQMRENQQKHVELRRTYLEELAEATVLLRRPWLQEEGNEQQKQEQTEKQVKELQNREEIRRMHRTIGKLLKEERGKGLTQLDVPDEFAIPPEGVDYGDPKDGKNGEVHGGLLGILMRWPST
mmetsp:Transcript_16534/g.23565  ORF Transcript_16534/g.23565 Transcript_16534/m.23565 type:complete len:716 (+) Transcript_16534:576-2723(+)